MLEQRRGGLLGQHPRFRGSAFGSSQQVADLGARLVDLSAGGPASLVQLRLRLLFGLVAYLCGVVVYLRGVGPNLLRFPAQSRGFLCRLLSRGGRLLDGPRVGRPHEIGDDKVEEIIVATLQQPPPREATHWSTRAMANHAKVSQTFVSRVWRAFGLKPHREDTWKLSADPQFIDKVRDIVGLYLDPPERAVVLCVDEQTQTQALDRTRPILPLLPATPARRTHDYKRNGTTDLFAALDVAAGRVHTQLHSRHRTVEFKKFLGHLDREVPAEFDVHLILDNYSTHKAPQIHRWLLRHPASCCTSPPPARRGSTWWSAARGWPARQCRRRWPRWTPASTRMRRCAAGPRS